MVQNYDDVRLEIDNFEAYMIMKEFNEGVPAAVFDVADQLDTLIHSENWKCIVSYINPSCNRVVRFLAKLGMETCSHLYTFDRPVGGVDELLDWDLGMGLPHPDYMDILVPSGAPNPVNFNDSISLAEKVDDLGLGQINAPRVARMELEVEELGEILDGATENFFIGSLGPRRSLLAREPPFADID